MSRRETIRVLRDSIINNRKSKWWTEKQYAQRYPIEESDKALENLFEVFNESWLKAALDGWANQRRQPHSLVDSLVAQGLHPLVILVELGKDLQVVKHLKNFDLLVKGLRDPSKFISAWLELELAAHCVRTGYVVELYPKIRAKMPDLRLFIDGEGLFVEIKEVHLSEVDQACLELSTMLLPRVSSILRDRTLIQIVLGGIPNESQAAMLLRKLPEKLVQPASQHFCVGSLKVWIRIEKADSASFMVIPSKETARSELTRLSRSIKHEAEQIPSSNSGIVILDAGTLHGYANQEIATTVEKTFTRYRLVNIIAVVILRSYKFFKMEKESEAIMLPNPNYNGRIPIHKLNGIMSFSRTRRLLPQNESPKILNGVSS